MTTKLLVKFESNWADEMDVVGFKLMTELEWNDFKEAARFILGKEPFTFYVGTNEEITWETYDDFIKSLKVKNITDEEESLIDKLFFKKGWKQFGTFPDVMEHKAELEKEEED